MCHLDTYMLYKFCPLYIFLTPKLLLCVFSETADMSQSLEDKLKAIRVWMTDTDEAVSSQDSLQSTQALLPDEIDIIYSSFMEVSWELMAAWTLDLCISKFVNIHAH